MGGDWRALQGKLRMRSKLSDDETDSVSESNIAPAYGQAVQDVTK